MTFHVPNKFRVRTGRIASTDDFGNNGAFEVKLKHGQTVFVIAAGIVDVRVDTEICERQHDEDQEALDDPLVVADCVEHKQKILRRMAGDAKPPRKRGQ